MALPLLRSTLRTACAALAILAPVVHAQAADELDPKKLEFFESRIRPILAAHCYECHSAQATELKGGLRLDLRGGWQAGGDSGEPAIVPFKPDESPLVRAVRHDNPDQAMPPNRPKLPEAAIADLIEWVRMGAIDPRTEVIETRSAAPDWETIQAARRDWWSLRPLVQAELPSVTRGNWPRHDLDRFILAALEARGLAPAAPAEPRALARRLSLALTGLPPNPETVDRFVADPSDAAFAELVDSLLASAHFGEHWARHWMDVVHYSDTHGYEWDAPAKNAWMYRDYLVRAFNADVPYSRLVLEQIAGDLIDPRVDPATGLNETLIGPMALRLGERRHGDNADVEGVTQEAMANIIDTVGKGFVGTTLACAQCHDHKFDAVSQKDYYALLGIFMSTRWGVRCADTVDPNLCTLEALRGIKQRIREEVCKVWQAEQPALAAKIQAIAADEKPLATLPETLLGFWQRSLATPVTAEEFAVERDRRIAENQANLTLVADFTREGGEGGWRWDGFGMQHGLAGDGEMVVADEGSQVVRQILPAGRWSHLWSARLAGALRSPMIDPAGAPTFSIGMAGGLYAAQSPIVDNAFHSERMQFLNQPAPGWLTFKGGNFSTLEGTPDQARRRFFMELVTKSLNNYFPPRTGYGGSKEAELNDERSWFGATRVYQHAAGKPPLDDLARYAPLLADTTDWATRLANLIGAAVDRFSRNACGTDDALLLDEALRIGWLANDVQAAPELARLVAEYQSVEKKLRPDRTIGSMQDWNEGRNDRLSVRGSYTEFGDEVPRSNARLLGGEVPASPSASGRLELARSLVSEQNTLTARVFVNRVWLYLFGEGLVRTPDDFGHLGQTPTHPELLDHLATRFVSEGWSLKKLVTYLVTSSTWRQSHGTSAPALELDPENRLWHHMPPRRMEAEAIRDSILAVSGRLDSALGGAPVDPYRTATDAAKRLFSGPLDGNGRRSIYTKMTLMEPPRFLAIFNQPLPKLTTGRRDVTNVPDQALALLNDPFVIAMAEFWGQRVLHDGSTSPEERAARMLREALARTARPEEVSRLVNLATRSAALRAASPGALMECQAAWQDVAHAIFNLKEFIYVP